MNERKTMALLVLASAFIALVCTMSVIAIIVSKFREQAVRREYYASILEQAPCLEDICPGFAGGRESALELLSQSDQVEAARPRGTDAITFGLIDAAEVRVGSGKVTFATNEAGEPTVVRRISFGFDHLTLDSVFSVLGEPDEYLFISGCGVGRRVFSNLYYAKEGVVVEIDYGTWTPGRQMLEDTTPIYVIAYFRPDDFQVKIEEWLQGLLEVGSVYDFHPSVTRDDLIAEIRPWPESGLAAGLTPTADFCPR